jgi:D-alanyl-D-alanine carboxypeptidase
VRGIVATAEREKDGVIHFDCPEEEILVVDLRDDPHPARPSSAFIRRKLGRLTTAAVVLTGLVATGALAPTVAGARTAPAKNRDAVQQRLNSLVNDDKFPAVLASVRDKDGQVRDYTSGVGDMKTGAQVPVDGEVRIGSNTKTFTATVVLQLVGEGKIDLDAPIEQYLPNLVRGDGIDGHKITVRQLLQHTSGLPDYDVDVTDDYVATKQHTHYEPRDLLDLGLSHKAVFAPGTGWSYSNTNYVVLGLLIQKITGRPVGEEITNRVIDRIGLRHTYWPALGDQSIQGPHAHGYFTPVPGGPLTDVTTSDPSAGWAAGQMISTPRDLNRFFGAVVDGKLLPTAQLKQMETTVAAPGSAGRGDEQYGLGLQTFTLSCGGTAWSHGGDYPGYSTTNAVSTDGRAVTLATTALPTSLNVLKDLENFVDAAMCE